MKVRYKASIPSLRNYRAELGILIIIIKNKKIVKIISVGWVITDTHSKSTYFYVGD